MINRTFEVEMYENEGVQCVFISTDGASGCEYEVDDIDEVGKMVVDYIKAYQATDKYRWNIHYVPDVSELLGVPNPCPFINAHTHGIYEHFKHKDLQMVIGSPDEVALILNFIGGLIEAGVRFNDGDSASLDINGTHEDEIRVKFKEFTECGRPVLRVILADKDGKFPDDDTCGSPFRYQYTIL